MSQQMHFPSPKTFVDQDKLSEPVLVVVVDVEEEFDWSEPFSRSETRVENIQELWRAQEIFDAAGVRPTYVVDYPVATNPVSSAIIRKIVEEGRCEIGAQLHPWVNPPHREELGSFNSFPGNLDFQLEFEKLETLTTAIEHNVGVRPVVYRAGRYGFGPNTASILEQLGYKLDLSIVPYTDYSKEGGPNYAKAGPAPFWFGEDAQLLEIPLTCGFSGLFAALGPQLFPIIGSNMSEALRLRGLSARLNLIDRIRLTPEGITSDEMVSVIETLVKSGQKIFQLSFHSSSLLAGANRYTKTEEDVERFLEKVARIVRLLPSTSLSQLHETLAGQSSDTLNPHHNNS